MVKKKSKKRCIIVTTLSMLTVDASNIKGLQSNLEVVHIHLEIARLDLLFLQG